MHSSHITLLVKTKVELMIIGGKKEKKRHEKLEATGSITHLVPLFNKRRNSCTIISYKKSEALLKRIAQGELQRNIEE